MSTSCRTVERCACRKHDKVPAIFVKHVRFRHGEGGCGPAHQKRRVIVLAQAVAAEGIQLNGKGEAAIGVGRLCETHKDTLNKKSKHGKTCLDRV